MKWQAAVRDWGRAVGRWTERLVEPLLGPVNGSTPAAAKGRYLRLPIPVTPAEPAYARIPKR